MSKYTKQTYMQCLILWVIAYVLADNYTAKIVVALIPVLSGTFWILQNVCAGDVWYHGMN